jgi:YggT family protein
MTNLIIDRISQFAMWFVSTAIIFVVALIILRLIADSSNLNFFGSTYVTLRRLTDPFLVRVRGALRGFGVNQKYAPLVTIFIAILLGWLVVRMTDTILGTIVGVMSGVQERSVAHTLGHLLIGLLSIYSLLIFMRIVFSWAMVGYSSRLMRFLYKTTEPLLAPLRRMIPPVGMFDISAFVAFIVIWIFQAAVAGTLLR